MTAPRAVVVALAAALAGCVEGPAAEPVPLGKDAPGAPASSGTADRQISAFSETNRTERGVGGLEHAHDYWLGRDRVDVFSGDLEALFPFPVFADGKREVATSEVFRPSPPELVFEGTSHVEVLVRDARVDRAVGAAHPTLRLALHYRTAADGGEAWRDGGPLVPGTPTILAVSARETDMPHSVASLWSFKVVAGGPDPFSVNATVTAVRGEDVPRWPGHPDLYAERTRRVVLDADVQTVKTGLAEIVAFGDATNWNHPPKVVSAGTTRLDVFANITKAETPGGVKPAGFFLEFRNASGDEVRRIEDADGENNLERYRFVVDVDEAGMDSPYAESSRWGFRVLAVFTNTAGFGLCPGCFPYTVDYHLTVVAHGASGSAEGSEDRSRER